MVLLGYKSIENTVAIMFGGRSSEHEISIRSAVYALKNIPENYRIIPVGINREGEMFSPDGTYSTKDFQTVTTDDLSEIVNGRSPGFLNKASIVRSTILPTRREVLHNITECPLRVLNMEVGVFFPVLHGPNGEDGRLQGLFDLAEVAYVGCDLRASVVGIDKNIQKILAKSVGVKVANYEMVEVEEWYENKAKVIKNIVHSIGFPCFVKPNSLGSAVGVNRAATEEQLEKRITEAFHFDEKIIIEEEMKGTEIECAFLGSAVSPRITVPGEIATDNFYSYDAKYMNDVEAKLFIPARLDPNRVQDIRLIAAKLAKVFGLEGLTRIDFWNCHKTQNFVFSEFNTMPGLTSISMFPKLWEKEGLQGLTWITELLERAKDRKRRRDELSYGVKE